MDRAIADRAERALSDEEGRAVTTAVQTSQFWTVPTLLWARNRNGVVDGSRWILEGRRGTAYHAVSRHPFLDEPVRALAVTLVKLADLPTSASGYLEETLARNPR